MYHGGISRDMKVWLEYYEYEDGHIQFGFLQIDERLAKEFEKKKPYANATNKIKEFII